jgi:hypothetical protein
MHLRPEKLLAACGPAAKDEVRQLYGDLYEREMIYSTIHFIFLTPGGDGFSPKLKDTYKSWSSPSVETVRAVPLPTLRKYLLW